MVLFRNKYTVMQLSFALRWLSLIVASPPEVSSCHQLTNCSACNLESDPGGFRLCSWCVKTQRCVPKSGLECVFDDKIIQVEDCPFTEKPGVQYNDTFARNEMFAISAAAYFDHPQNCMNNIIPGTVVRKQVKVPCDSSSRDSCSAYTALSANRKAMILGFRGTNNAVQLFLESWETVMSSKVSIIGGGKVSKYFYDAFDAVWKGGIKEDFLNMTQRFNGYNLWISGHSLGGAMASIAAHVIANGGYYDGKYIKLVTFGQPRTGDHNFAFTHDSTIGYTYRVTHGKDIVVHLPTRSFKNYHHHRFEIWYDNDMTEGAPYTECYTPDDDQCSNSNGIDVSIQDHLTYFNKAISWIGDIGCV